MTTDHWARVEELFEAARRQAVPDREAFLRQTCGDDQGLLAEVRSLLEASAKAGTFLATPAINAVPDTAAVANLAGTTIGSYRLAELVGVGGMGTVYRAERVDVGFRQEVAVKLIKPGMASSYVVHRFQQERQALAELNHPNTARLLDGGETAEGLPYLVMEFVDGQRIDRYCDENKLSTSQRLELFRAVCAAVEHSHRHLIVHRDLKPGNILVTKEGVPKLLDFGIAKLLRPLDGSAILSTATATLQRLMTPDYASPEQVRGESISTASDVYSLGVVLYELLTGRRPYCVTRRPGFEIERLICEDEPLRPSTAVLRDTEVLGPDGTRHRRAAEEFSSSREGRPERLHRRLVGDLDNILLMALRKEPERRYSSVAQLSEDIHRHLSGMPVVARADTVRYRTAKFLLRHRVKVVAALCVVVILVGWLISAVTQQRKISEQFRRASASEERARREAAALERLRSWLAFLLQQGDQIAAEDETALSLREVLDRTARAVADNLDERERRRVIDDLADMHQHLGAFAEAQRWWQEGLQLARRTPDPDPLTVARYQERIALCLTESGQSTAAEEVIRECLATLRRHLGNEAAPVAAALRLLGTIRLRLGDYDSPQKHFEEALRIQKLTLLSPHPEIVETLQRQATYLLAYGRRTAAAAVAQKAVEMVGVLYRGDHHVKAWVFGLNAGILQDQGRYEEAERFSSAALEMARNLYGNDAARPLALQLQLAVLLKDRGQYAQAKKLAREVYDKRKRLYPESHHAIAGAHWHLAQICADSDGLDEAESLSREAARMFHKIGNVALAARIRALLGRVLVLQGRNVEAVTELRLALEVLKRDLPDFWETAQTNSVLGEALVGVGKYTEAESLMVESYPIIKTDRGATHRRTREAAERLVRLYRAWGKADKRQRYERELATLPPVETKR